MSEAVPIDFSYIIDEIRSGKLSQSNEVALKTEEFVERIIAEKDWKNAQELMNLIKAEIKLISEALPLHTISTNILRHVLNIIREEYDIGFKSHVEQSLHQMMTSDSDAMGDYSKMLDGLKTSIIDHLSEYKTELETSIDNIAAQATDHIYTNEIILTFGQSNTVEQFLKAASRTHSFQVIVAENAPSYNGHSMAVSLANHNIQTTVISDTAIFSVMSRVNKVIIGVHSVMANGALKTACGVHAVALAAKHYSVPVMVLTHLYKLSPTYVSSYSFDACSSPASVLPYSFAGDIVSRTNIINPMFDYVPPELVTLFITYQGGNAPSYIYRLLSELYHPDDHEL